MEKKTIQDLPLKHAKVLIRCDFNVPLNEDGSIHSDQRIVESLPTIEYALKAEAKVILISHLGRPKKRDAKYSLAAVAKRLSEKLNMPVQFAPDCLGEQTKKMVDSLKPKELLLLENVRFYEAEEHPEKDLSFAEKLASYGDVFVNDAFATAHRKHSSNYEICKYFKETSVAGFLLEKEINYLYAKLHNPKHPFFAILGGSKISTKMGVIRSLLPKVDALFIGGGMAYTFLKAQGLSVGHSLIEESFLEECKKLIKECEEKQIHLHLPVDVLVAPSFKSAEGMLYVELPNSIDDSLEGVSIGPKTIEAWKKELVAGQLIFWNGPLGVFEVEAFAQNTREIAKILSEMPSATTIIGGGDSVAAIEDMGIQKKFSHLSTGGGACLEFIEKGTLPAIEVLTDA